jgi:DNA polymerase III epsilon subunit-like protein
MPQLPSDETYISVDVETAGPTPGEFSLLSIGACLIRDLRRTFYAELQPDRENEDPDATAIHGLSLERLSREGQPPELAMRRFAEWVKEVTPPGGHPVFVAFNAPFDWSFANAYFHRYLGVNPFGHTALDIKAFYMGFARVSWRETSMHYLGPRYLGKGHIGHNALDDAIDQAHIFRKILEEAGYEQRE